MVHLGSLCCQSFPSWWILMWPLFKPSGMISKVHFLSSCAVGFLALTFTIDSLMVIGITYPYALMYHCTYWEIPTLTTLVSIWISDINMFSDSPNKVDLFYFAMIVYPSVRSITITAVPIDALSLRVSYFSYSETGTFWSDITVVIQVVPPTLNLFPPFPGNIFQYKLLCSCGCHIILFYWSLLYVDLSSKVL